MSMTGALVLDKPAGITSHDAVRAARRLTGERRIGHLGTLDPFATGVLVLLLGQATRLARFYQHCEKEYEGVIRFGFSTDTYDFTGHPASEDRGGDLQPDVLRALFQQFTGTFPQQPPDYSAKKIGGVAAYRRARRGEAVELAPVPVTIHRLELTWTDGARAGFEARVSSGTYLRSLAHDLGQRLGVGAHLAALRRTAVGDFTLAEALSLAELEERLLSGQPCIIEPHRLLPEFPAAHLSEKDAISARHGRDLELEQTAEQVKLIGPEGTLVAVAERVGPGRYHPLVVISDAAPSAVEN